MRLVPIIHCLLSLIGWELPLELKLLKCSSRGSIRWRSSQRKSRKMEDRSWVRSLPRQWSLSSHGNFCIMELNFRSGPWDVRWGIKGASYILQCTTSFIFQVQLPIFSLDWELLRVGALVSSSVPRSMPGLQQCFPKFLNRKEIIFLHLMYNELIVYMVLLLCEQKWNSYLLNYSMLFIYTYSSYLCVKEQEISYKKSKYIN